MPEASSAPRHRLRRPVTAVLVVLAALATAALLAPAAGAQIDPAAPNVPTPVEPADPQGQAVVEAPAEPAEPAEVNVTVVSDDSGLSRSVLIVLLLTIGSVAPAILLLMTSFTRFMIVLGLVRQAMGAPQVPPNQVLIGLSLFLTFFVMGPVLSEVNEQALQPLLAGEMDEQEALAAGFAPMRTFMLANTEDDDLGLLLDIADMERPADAEELSWTVVVPAFVLSELRTAFMIGFVVFVPFLVIDLVISSILMSLGMVMLPPIFISLPIKILLFVLVDGWALLIGSLAESVTVVT